MATTLSHTSSPHPPTDSYPPGVLVGRPIEMFEACPGLDLYGVPAQWFHDGTTDLDVDMLQELCDALDHRHDEEMNWIDCQLQYLERFQDPTAFYLYPMIHKDGGFTTSIDYFHETFGVQDALQQFEEDFEFE